MFLSNYEADLNDGNVDYEAKRLADAIRRNATVGEDVVNVTIVFNMKTGKSHRDPIGAVAGAELRTIQLLINHYLSEHDALHVGGMFNGALRIAIIDLNEVESVEILGTEADKPSDEETRRTVFGVFEQ